jgi:hypothetical protein
MLSAVYFMLPVSFSFVLLMANLVKKICSIYSYIHFMLLEMARKTKKENTELPSKMGRKTFCEFFMHASGLYELLCITCVLWCFFLIKI